MNNMATTHAGLATGLATVGVNFNAKEERMITVMHIYNKN